MCIRDRFQSVYLFADTIENNIKFGCPDATHEQVVEAAKKACCHDFISALPDGYYLSLIHISKTVGSVFQNPRSQFFNVDTTSEITFGCENLGLSLIHI